AMAPAAAGAMATPGALTTATLTATDEPSPWLHPDTHEILDHRLTLDLLGGTLRRRTRYRLPDGRTLRVEQHRLVHMGDPHLAALRTEFTAEGWSGELEVESALDGDVTNSGVARYRDLDGRHLTRVRVGGREPDTVWLGCRTRTSEVRIGMAARTVAHHGDTAPGAGTGAPGPRTGRLGSRTSHAYGSAAVAPGAADVRSEIRPAAPRAVHVLTVPIAPGRPVVVDKTVALYTSLDAATSDPLQAACDHVTRAPTFDRVLATHRTAWELLWRRAELDVPGEAGLILRFHLFHVLQTLSPHTAELDVGVPARGLHGEAYRGHVFWDELFVLPYLNLHFPEVSRALLTYRHRRLPQACRAAADVGRSGAMYPWQSGSDGREETQQLHLNPRSGRWMPDHSRLQHHVGSAVAYNVWQYCEASGDTEFLHTQGAEMLLQIARFWADSAVYDAAHGRYSIRGVVGPDEYHEAYPDAETPGLDDNAYTNVTAAWVLARALDVVRDLPEPRRVELFERAGLLDEELAHMDEVSRRLRVPFHQGVISQFDGFGELAELDWERYRARYGDIRRLDRILEAEDDSVNCYQVCKQADVLMLGYLFSPTELAGLFDRLGYALDDETWHRTVDYYLHRTSHGSTLSGLVHGWVLARVRRAEAWRFCQEALAADVADIQGGTTAEGIHLGAMAGTLDLVQRGLTGLETRAGAIWLDPVPLPELSEFGFSLRYRGHWGIGVRMRAGRVQVTVPTSSELPVTFALADHEVTVPPGESTWLHLPSS
ncbi:glycoside hydrolase family 65 protein, partial [Streptomyces sp. URMC 123]|uniref:glycoside hydrolase family 65 protein n=1 Tax=Streptomyces sp. URMC 123 TaxID=3423403 RepID=UPI003F1DBC72